MNLPPDQVRQIVKDMLDARLRPLVEDLETFPISFWQADSLPANEIIAETGIEGKYAAVFAEFWEDLAKRITQAAGVTPVADAHPLNMDYWDRLADAGTYEAILRAIREIGWYYRDQIYRRISYIDLQPNIFDLANRLDFER